MFSEGFAITKRKQTPVTSLNYRCPHLSCGRTFANPLKSLNLSQEDPEPYEACPHCLTEITNQESELASQTFRETPETPVITKTQPVDTTEKPTLPEAHCSRHFGYLSERSSKEKIPEECVACAEIVNCMLKEIKK